MPAKPTWVSRFTGYFLKRQQISFVIFLFVLIGGTTALAGLRREGFPQVPVKVIVINTVYRGAAATEVEQSVTNPIESAIKDLKEVKSTSSTSAESNSTVVVTLDETAGLDASLQDITSKISGVELPKDAEKPSVTQPTTGNSAFVFGLTGDFTSEQLLAQGHIFEREVASIPGIKQVKLQSKFTDRISVKFSPAKLTATGVDTARITSSLATNNLNFPAGNNLTIDGSRATALVSGRLTSLDDLGATLLPTVFGGTARLDSVATLEREVDQDGAINEIGSLQNGLPVARPGIVYSVDIRSDADILNVDTSLTKTLEELKDNATLAPGLSLVRLIDGAASTSEQINEIKGGAIGEKWDGLGAFGYVGYLVGGIWLLMLAMFLFVNLRTALIAGVAIPLSFLFTLMALYFAGITLNTLTLFSMILVLGLVVDPAIVVLESIQRYKDMGRSGREGVQEAISSIGPGLLLATVCSIIVFTPFGIVSGVFGEIIKFIPITVIPALVASFFVPLIFLTPLAARFIKGKRAARTSEMTTSKTPASSTSEKTAVTPATWAKATEAALWPASRWFKRANLFILNRLWLQIVIMLLAVTVPIGLTGYLFVSGQVKSAQFSKPHDTIEALVNVSYPASFTDTQVRDLAHQTEAVLGRHSEIKSYYFMSQSTTGFTIFMNLTPIKERETIADDLTAKLSDELPKDPSRQIFAHASTLSYGPPENIFPVQLQIHDNDLAKLKTFALAVGKHAHDLDGVNRVSDGYTDKATNAVEIRLNKTALAEHGLNVALVGSQLAGLLGEQTLTKLTLGESQLDVVASYETASSYNSLAALKTAQIGTPAGPIPLGDIATFSDDSAAGSIQHQDGQRFAIVRAAVESGANSFQIQKDLNDWAKSQLAAYHLDDNALESKGEGDDIAKSFINLFAALGIAIVLIYLVLALFFGSFLKPLIITFALPLSFVGVFPMLALLGTDFGFLEILGLITLAGIVVNVGIFVIDYANHRVAEGMPVKEAIAQATAVRFRPIFLTKITALGSLLPLAILSPFWRGLASVIIAGILTSGILSLFTTPILYSWFTNLAKFPDWLGAKLRQHL